jgi:uncharacterized protein
MQVNLDRSGMMLINLSEIISSNNATETYEEILPLKDLSFYGEKYQIEDGVAITFDIVDTNEQNVSINGSLDTRLHMKCNRCNAPLKYSLHVDFYKMINLSTKDDDDEEANEELEGVLTGSLLNVDVFAMNEILLNFPMKVLCKDDCKGVCQHCGINLNKESCACEKDDIDPRWQGLKLLYEENFKEV